MIEKATVEDLDQIIKLKIRMFEDMGAKWLLAENAEDLILSRYREFYAQDTAQHVVIRDEGSIVSCAGGFIKRSSLLLFYQVALRIHRRCIYPASPSRKRLCDHAYPRGYCVAQEQRYKHDPLDLLP